ncbi:tetratricopeptide repeat protein (plasmid) [Nocardiopsis flavescens]|nr:tetratricopeptide repeat protein [Nocardiopsis flavescens]
MVVSAVAGMGGVGKTALAVRAAHRAWEQGWFSGYLFVDLHGYTPATPALTGVAALDVLLRQVGVSPDGIPPGLDERSIFYRSALADLSRADEHRRPVLVVADNAHRLDQVEPLVPGVGGHRLVVTSRGGLHSLTGVRHVDLDVLDPAESVALLAFALTANNPEDPRATDEQALGRLAGVCGHLPLALEIAAAQLARKPRLAPAQLAERLEQAASRVDKLTDRGAGAERSRALRAVFDTSLDQLSPQEVRVFLLVASAPGPTTSTHAAAALTGLDVDEVEEVLEELEAAYLLTQPSSGRWGAHDLLTDHAATHPCPPQDRAQALGRLLDYYTDTTDAAVRRIRALPGRPVPERFPDQQAALDWLDSERPTLVAAALAAPGIGNTRAAVRLPRCLADYLNRRRRFDEWKQLARSSQATAHITGDQSGEAWAWNSLGSALGQERRFTEAIDAYTHARDLHRQVPDTPGEAAALNNLGDMLREVRRFDEAIDACTRACGLYQQTGKAYGEAIAWSNLGNALREAGRFEEAVDACSRARKAFHQFGDSRWEAIAWNNLGMALQQLGRFEEAIDAHTHARDAFLQSGYDFKAAAAWNNLGLVFQQTDRFKEAIEAHTRARDIHDQFGDDYGKAQAWGDLGNALQETGRFKEALEAFTHRLNYCRQVDDAHGEAQALWSTGEALVRLERAAEAVEILSRAVGLFESAGDEDRAATGREYLALVQEGLGAGTES